MQNEAQLLGAIISRNTGLRLSASTGVIRSGQKRYVLRPSDQAEEHTFSIQSTVNWRRLLTEFIPGTFARDLITQMGQADESGRATFMTILTDCRNRGAQITFQINGISQDFAESRFWTPKWERFSLIMSKGQLDVGTEEGESDFEIVCQWMGRFAAAIVAILPLDEGNQTSELDVAGYLEGTLSRIATNRYERDRRNRAAAIAIHGSLCSACGVDFGKLYGPVAAGYIEVHHVIPLSELGPGYVVDPQHDLIPLCPNCHRVAHRRDPPFTIDEIASFLEDFRSSN